MDSFLISIFSAFWFGLLSSVSPCQLATNIAAVSFIGRRIDKPRMVVITGLVYSLGRMLTYITLSIIIVSAFLTIPNISDIIQKYMNRVLGPILIIIGMSLLELIKFFNTSIKINSEMQNRIERLEIVGAGLLGIIFALSFCPMTAALFLGSLIPLAIHEKSVVILPLVFGIGTALPVLTFSILLSVSSALVSKVFRKISQIELWARRITGSVFILVGIYYCLVYIFGIL